MIWIYAYIVIQIHDNIRVSVQLQSEIRRNETNPNQKYYRLRQAYKYIIELWENFHSENFTDLFDHYFAKNKNIFSFSLRTAPNES